MVWQARAHVFFPRRRHTYTHVHTLVQGARDFYTLSNNEARTETPQQAIEVDTRLKAAWAGHTRPLYIVDNSTGFSGKLQRVLSCIGTAVGLPDLNRAFRKFLVKEYPDLSALPFDVNTFYDEKVGCVVMVAPHS